MTAPWLARRDRLRTKLAEWGSSLLVTHPVNVRYLTGLDATNAQLLVTAEHGDVLATDKRYIGRAADLQDPPELLTTRTGAEDLVRLVHERGWGRIGFEGAHLTYEMAMDLISLAGTLEHSVISVTGAVENLRLTKDADEISRLRGACKATDDAYGHILTTIREGDTERQIARRLEDHYRDNADGPSFPSIVAFGPNAAIPHHAPTDRPLTRGEVIKIDAGAVVDGYHADMTRCAVLGEATDDVRTIHDIVAKAQAVGVDRARPGVTGGEVDRAVRRVIESAGYGDEFLHGTGHGVGLEIHESPAVGHDSGDSLAVDMTITVEPGIYLPGIGGVRVEDTVLVRPDGPAEPLTTTPRELQIL